VLTEGAPRRLLTVSEISCFKDCNQRWWFRYVMNRAARRTAHALWFGTTIHTALEAYWKARKASRCLTGDVQHLDAALATLPADADPYDLVRMKVMLSAYAAMWNPTSAVVRYTELPFNLPLIDPRTGLEHPVFRRAGKIDLVLAYRDGSILVEHKTTTQDASDSSVYRRRLTIDEQLSHYTAALDAMRLPVAKIVYDVLDKPDLRPLLKTPSLRWTKAFTPKATKKNPNPVTVEPRLYAGQRTGDETMEAFAKRLLTKWMETPSDYIFQIGVERLKHQREEWLDQVWAQAEIMAFALEHGYAPRNSRSCSNHFGTSCDYLPVCEGTARIDDDSKYALLDDPHPELKVDAVAA